jgi:hypothetical protein
MAKSFSSYTIVIVLGIALSLFIATNYSSMFEPFQTAEVSNTTFTGCDTKTMFLVAGIVCVFLFILRLSFVYGIFLLFQF